MRVALVQTEQCFPTFFDLWPEIAPRRLVVTSLQHTINIFHRNSYLFRLHTKLKGNKWKTIVI